MWKPMMLLQYVYVGVKVCLFLSALVFLLEQQELETHAETMLEHMMLKPFMFYQA